MLLGKGFRAVERTSAVRRGSLSRHSFGGSPVEASYVCGTSDAGALPGDGVFVPVSPVCPLTRPNRMTVSPGPRAGATTIHKEVSGILWPCASCFSTRAQDRLGLEDFRDRASGRVRNVGLDDHHGAARVQRTRDGLRIAVAHGAQEVGLALDRRRPGGA